MHWQCTRGFEKFHIGAVFFMHTFIQSRFKVYLWQLVANMKVGCQVRFTSVFLNSRK